MRKGKRNEIENKRWDQAGRQAGRGRFSSLIGCRLSLAVRSSGCSRLRSSDPSECCRGETESALLHLDDLFLELTWSRWRCESGNTHFFVPFRVCTWIMVHWVSGARRNCWDWPPALRACERRNQRLFSLIFRGEIPKSLSLDYGLLRWVVRVYSRTVFWLLNVILQTRRVQNARRWRKSALYFQPNVNLNELMLCDSIPKWSVNINIALWFCCVPLAPFSQY